MDETAVPRHLFSIALTMLMDVVPGERQRIHRQHHGAPGVWGDTLINAIIIVAGTEPAAHDSDFKLRCQDIPAPTRRYLPETGLTPIAKPRRPAL